MYTIHPTSQPLVFMKRWLDPEAERSKISVAIGTTTGIRTFQDSRWADMRIRRGLSCLDSIKSPYRFEQADPSIVSPLCLSLCPYNVLCIGHKRACTRYTWSFRDGHACPLPTPQTPNRILRAGLCCCVFLISV